MEINKESGTKKMHTYVDFSCGKANGLLLFLKYCDVSLVDFYLFNWFPHALKW